LKQTTYKSKKISIKWKVFTYLALFTAIILAILWTVQTVFLADIYKAIKMRSIYKTAEEIEKVITTDKLEEKVSSLAYDNMFCIHIIDNKGKVIASAESLPNCVVHHISYRDHAKLYLDAKNMQDKTLIERFKFNTQTGSYNSVKDADTVTEENIVMAKVTEHNGKDAVIFINALLTPVDATVKTLNIMLGFISIILLVIAMGVSLIISATITRPIKKLTLSAKELASGNYDANFSRKGYKES
jgi:sensor histidine kinase YesM